jgi:hypothetical protein
LLHKIAARPCSQGGGGKQSERPLILRRFLGRKIECPRALSELFFMTAGPAFLLPGRQVAKCKIAGNRTHLLAFY